VHDNFPSTRLLVLSPFTIRNFHSLCTQFLIYFLLNCMPVLFRFCAWYFSYFLLIVYLFYFISVHNNFLSIGFLVLPPFTLTNIYSLGMAFLNVFLIVYLSYLISVRNSSLSINIQILYLLSEVSIFCAVHLSYFFYLIIRFNFSAWQLSVHQVSCRFSFHYQKHLLPVHDMFHIFSN
jgi:hypothetical protein